MTEQQPEPKPTPEGMPGEDFCQLCGAKTKFVGGPSYDLEHFECTGCKAVHTIALEYSKGKVTKRTLESVY